MRVITHVVCHEHEHEKEGDEDYHSIEQRPVQHGSSVDNREPARLIVSKNIDGSTLVHGEDSPWSVLTTFAASFSTVPEPDPPLPLLCKNLLVDLLRVRAQPLEEYSQQNNGNQGENKAGGRPDVPRLEHDAGIDYLSVPRSSWPLVQ